MRTAQTIAGLARFERRGAGTDAERRAANWLANELTGSQRTVTIEPFWCRPNWALAHAWHVTLGLAGSLVTVSEPRVGSALILVALLCLIADFFLGVSPGRRLTPEHASQNVVASTPSTIVAKPVRLIITANYDAGRTGLAFRDRPRALASGLRNSARGLGPGWLGWLAIALAWLLAIGILRLDGAKGTAVGIAQLIPTVALVLALALLLDIASSEFGPAAGDNGSGVAAAIALVRALDAAPPRHASVELVLQGAADGTGIGLRKHLRSRRDSLQPANAIVLGVAACTAGAPHWWRSDGALVALSFFARLRQLCQAVATEEPGLDARPRRGRGCTPALAARLAGLPAIVIGCLDDRGLSPRSHQRDDMASAVKADAPERAVELGLLLVDALDEHLAQAPSADTSDR